MQNNYSTNTTGGKWAKQLSSLLKTRMGKSRFRKTVFLLLVFFTTANMAWTQAPNITWQKSLGGTDNDIANSIQQTTDGGYIVAGETQSTNGDVTGNHGSYDYWVVKL